MGRVMKWRTRYVRRLAAALLYLSVTGGPALAQGVGRGAVAGAPVIAWFCGGRGAANACPAQVRVQIIGTYIYEGGAVIGRYADDEDPTQAADVAEYRAEGSTLVLAGLASNFSPPVPGALSALEWYPWPMSVYDGALSAVPPAGYAAYILQGGFSWQAGYSATAAEIQQSYCGALAYHPQMIAFYWWTPAAWAAVNGARCPIDVWLTQAPRHRLGSAVTRARLATARGMRRRRGSRAGVENYAREAIDAGQKRR
jgi:hypothetical protein